MAQEDTKKSVQSLLNNSHNETFNIQERLIYGYDGANVVAFKVSPDGSLDVGSAEYALRLDDYTTTSVSYVGIATVGALEASAVWQIKKIDETTGLSITWADGDANFNNVWTNRATLTYS